MYKIHYGMVHSYKFVLTVIDNIYIGKKNANFVWQWVQIHILLIYSSKKVLHHLYYINIFRKILQTARKITYVYWKNSLVMTADRNSDKTSIILFLLLQSRNWGDVCNLTHFEKITTFEILLTFR